MKKAMSLLLAMLMVVGCFAGCKKDDGASSDSGSGNSSTPVNNSNESQSSGAEELKDVTLQVWVGYGSTYQDTDMVYEEFNKELAKYLPNTKVEFTQISNDDYGTRWAQMLSTQEAVDLAWRTRDPEDAKKGNVLALDDLLAEYGQDIASFLGEASLDNHRAPDGKLYFIPTWQGLTSVNEGIAFPNELLQYVPDTWTSELEQAYRDFAKNSSTETTRAIIEKMEEYLAALKANDKMYLGVYNVQNIAFPYRYQNIEWMWYIDWTDDTFTVKDRFAEDSYSHLWYEYAAKWFKEGYIRSDIATSMESNEWNGTLDNTNYVTRWVNYYCSVEEEEEILKTRYGGLDVTVVPITFDNYMNLGDATGVSIPYTAKNPERAMMFYNEFWKNAELYQLWCYGIEGTHYNKNDDGTITLVKDKDGNTSYQQHKWVIGNCYNSLLEDGNTVNDYALAYEIEKSGKVYSSPLMSFVVDRDVNDVDDTLININEVTGQYLKSLEYGYTGDKWEETYAEMRAKLDQLGMPALTEEIQNQVNDYLAENGITSWNYPGIE